MPVNVFAGCQRRAGIPLGRWKTRSPSRNGNGGIQRRHGEDVFDQAFMLYSSSTVISLGK